jgi:hypothetical protein
MSRARNAWTFGVLGTASAYAPTSSTGTVGCSRRSRRQNTPATPGSDSRHLYGLWISSFEVHIHNALGAKHADEHGGVGTAEQVFHGQKEARMLPQVSFPAPPRAAPVGAGTGRAPD